MEKVRLGDICEVLNGYAFKSDKYVSDGIRIIRIANVQKGYIEDSTPVFYPDNDVLAKKYLLYENDLLISLTGNVGRVARLNKELLPAALNQRVACLREKNSNYDMNFLFNFLNSDYFEEECISNSKGVAQKNMSTEWLKDYEIPYFTLDEQHRISFILDKLTDLITKRKQQLQKLDELVKARFVEMFGDPITNSNWMHTSVGKFCFVTKLAGLEYTEYIDYQDHGDVIMVRGLNVKNGRLKLDDVWYIDSNVSNLLPRSQLKENDIVMTYVGVNIGDVALIDGNNKYHLAPNVAKISINSFDILNPIFLVDLFAFNKDNFAKNATNTAKQALNMDKIRKLDIILPPINLQNKFAAFAKRVDKSKSSVRKSLDKLELLKKSLMQEYFG